MFKEFREFAVKGNVLDMAIGIVMGTTFGKIVSSLVGDVLMPPIGLVLGGINFSHFFVDLSRRKYATLAEAQAAGAPTINYGLFVQTVLDFTIVAFVMFLLVRQVNRLRGPAPAPATRECPYCLSAIPRGATRCAHCTSEVRGA